MNVLVTGGAGYIGSHAVRLLLDEGHHVVVLDNLSTGHRESIPHETIFYQGSVGNADVVTKLLATEAIDAVLHFAASIEVAESISNPFKYYQNNFSATLTFLQLLKDYHVQKFVFSSTAAVYGIPTTQLLSEDHPKSPLSPYGQSKYMVELALEDFSKAYGLGYAVLRYFNVAAAHPSGIIGEDHRPETHLIPKILRAALNSDTTVPIYGTDYPTNDGTCIRDYVHVQDLVAAHVLALNKIKAGESFTYNLGSEHGYSVLQVIDACRAVTGAEIKIQYHPRRPGDSPVLVASSQKIKSQLGWVPQYPDLITVIQHAWNWHRQHPEGYLDKKIN